MNYRSLYYGGFPGPPESQNQSHIQRNYGHPRGFIPPGYVHPGQDVTYFAELPGTNFAPTGVDHHFAGNRYPSPEFYYHSPPYFANHSVDFPVDTAYNAGYVDQFARSPSQATADISTNNFYNNTSQPATTQEATASSPAPSSEATSQAAGGKSRRFSRQRNVKDNAMTGTSGEVFTHPNETASKESHSKRQPQGKHSIRFSHQREDSRQTEGSRQRKNETDSSKKEPASKASSSQAGKSRPMTTVKGKVSKAKKESTSKVLPADQRNQTSVLIDQLSTGTYECMVCCDRVRPQHAVWNCTNCYNLFHMGCIKKWARSPAAKVEDTGWRCPGCQNVTKNIPNSYYCFCGKLRDPEYARGETPHSCGNICGRARKDNLDCTHPCNILCHPGPCPQCPATITKRCKCGKLSSRIRCSQQKSFICNKPCEKLKNCRIHKCMEICHSGECQNCDVTVEQSCFCGKATRELICGSSEHVESTNKFSASYSCEKLCEKNLECGNHKCEQICHPGACKGCPLRPSVVTHCPCTQTKLEEIKGEDGKPIRRESCTDPVPTCGKVCGKPLSCGGDEVHLCKLLCHTGPCPPCADGESNVICRCKKTEEDVPCRDYEAMRNFVCDRRCNKKRKCGRHKCGQTCCVDTTHACMQICGRKLSCGKHRCDELCHRGACHTCYDVSFDELRCYCGDQVIFPPIQCGTKPPECSNECTRVHSCAHPIRHTCHVDDKCPPCTELVKKPCNCGRIVRGNIMCHIDNVSCGVACGKVLPCGHKCLKPCHKEACMEEGERCKQPCSIMRVECIHPCANPCHHGQPCPSTPCRAMVTLKCPCGRRESQMECSAGGATVPSVNSSIYHGKEGIDIGKLLRPGSASLRTLQCDEECAVEARNKRLAEALNIQPEDYGSGTKQQYSEFLIQAAKNDSAFVRTVEKDLINLVEAVEWLGLSKQSHSFACMKREKRQVVHELSEAFKCKSESRDEEPRRNVVATATKGISKQPTPLLSDVVMEQATAEKFFSPKPAAKGRLLSSVKLVSYSSSKTNVATEPKRPFSFQRKAPALYQLPSVSAAMPSRSRFEALSVTSGAKESRLTTSAAPVKSNNSHKPPPAAASEETQPKPAASAIDYFDMTD